MLRLLALVLPGLVTAAVVNRTKSYLDDVDVHNFEANHSSHGRRLIEVRSTTGAKFDVARAPAPLWRDPLYDGAADPTVVWDDAKREWRVFYTQRRAKGSEDLPGVSWAYGTAIGMATSSDFGVTWRYQGTCQGLDFEAGLNTFWAPDVVRGLNDGLWHMHVTYIRRVRMTWGGKQMIAHLVSTGDLSKWQFKNFVEVADDRPAFTGVERREFFGTSASEALATTPALLSKVIDADVRRLPDGRWKMWFKDLKVAGGGTTAACVSTDLEHWHRLPGVEVEDTPAHEAPVVFEWKSFYWLMVDPLNEQGLRVYRSTDAATWTVQPNKLLDGKGRRTDDGNGGSHPDVVVLLDEDQAFLFYFVHPAIPKKNAKPSAQTRRTSLQVAELGFDGRWLTCDRDKYYRGSSGAPRAGIQSGRMGGGGGASSSPFREGESDSASSSSPAAEVLQATAAKKAVAHAAARRGGTRSSSGAPMSSAKGAEASAVAASWWSSSSESPFKSSA